MPAVSNTSPIFNLACIDRLALLHNQFGAIWIPSAVDTELREIPDRAIRSGVDDARTGGWLIVRPTTEADLVKLLTVDLHQGEAEAIALAVETKSDISSSSASLLPACTSRTRSWSPTSAAALSTSGFTLRHRPLKG